MAFYDNFIEVVPGFLVDPAVKLRVQFGGESGLGPNEPLLYIGYDPEIDPNRLLVPPSEEGRKFWLLSPLTAHLADAPTLFQSSQYQILESVRLSWKLHGARIAFKVENDTTSFRLKAKIIENKRLPNLSDSGRDTLLYAIRSATRLTAMRSEDFRSPRFSNLEFSEVWLRTEVAIEFFELPLDRLISPELGWVTLSAREIMR